MNKLIITLAVSALAICTFAQERGESGGRGRPRDRGRMQAIPEAKLHRFSTTVEKERPRLNKETKDLIAAYRRNPSEENRAALRRQVAKNYDAVVARKKAKLEELRRTARHQSKVDEMQVIVDEMLRDREQRIEASMRRFTDKRMRPGMRESKAEYLPLIGAAENVSIARIPVTNADYAEFVKATGRKPPHGWKDGAAPEGRGRHPVVNVSFDDAVAYCKWLGEKDKTAMFRLPTEEEWELAAGHMPKDADFNCKDTHPEIASRDLHNGKLPSGTVLTTPVDAYEKTLSACGAIDMWGNCWEWTSTDIVAQNGRERGQKVKEIKGGSWYAHRTSCRTEMRGEGRAPSLGYNTVGFRVVRETK
ncbi:MAG: SUMF1/EgtB/PvdO family nonheme iron enzyme [Kiritimatiellae bacterium]|nr:SUMF1/EgtB/PvdO family nonheme iron enzyme [Kiritimatiellia bacterium]